MTTECHISACVAHSCHIQDEGPFCDMPVCIHKKSPDRLTRLTTLSKDWTPHRKQYLLHIIIDNNLGFEAIIAADSPQKAITQVVSKLTDLENDNILLMTSLFTEAAKEQVHDVLDQIKDKIEEIT